MADKKISQLGSASTLTGAEQVPLVQSSVTKRSTVADVADFPLSRIAVLTANETLGATRHVVFGSTAGGAIALTMPAATNGRPFLFRRLPGSSNAMTVARAGSDLFLLRDGTTATSITVTDVRSFVGLVVSGPQGYWVELGDTATGVGVTAYSRRAAVGSLAILCSGDVSSGNLSNTGSGAGSLTAGTDAAYAAASILGGRAVQAIGTDDGRWRGLADVLGGAGWTARSLSVWAFPLSFATNVFLWGQEQDPGAWTNPEIHTGITLDNATTGSWGVQFAASSARRQVFTNGVGDMQLGVWNHLAATLTVSGSDVLVKLYLNGVLVVASTVTSVTPDAAVSGARWSLGAEPKDAASRNPFKGALDDARADSTTWTAAYVRELYQRGIGAWTGS